MNMVSKRLVIIASFCLSVVLCHADTVATQSMPTVVTAVTAEKSSEVLKPQSTAPVATASQGLRAKAMDKLRGLWGACKDKSATAVGYAGSALGYGYRGVKLALELPNRFNLMCFNKMFGETGPVVFLSLILWSCLAPGLASLFPFALLGSLPGLVIPRFFAGFHNFVTTGALACTVTSLTIGLIEGFVQAIRSYYKDNPNNGLKTLGSDLKEYWGKLVAMLVVTMALLAVVSTTGTEAVKAYLKNWDQRSCTNPNLDLGRAGKFFALLAKPFEGTVTVTGKTLEVLFKPLGMLIEKLIKAHVYLFPAQCCKDICTDEVMKLPMTTFLSQCPVSLATTCESVCVPCEHVNLSFQ